MTKREILKKAERIAELKNLIEPYDKEIKKIQAELKAYAENNADTWENLKNDKVSVEYVNGSISTRFDKALVKKYLTKNQYDECTTEKTSSATIRVKRVKG